MPRPITIQPQNRARIFIPRRDIFLLPLVALGLVVLIPDQVHAAFVTDTKSCAVSCTQNENVSRETFLAEITHHPSTAAPCLSQLKMQQTPSCAAVDIRQRPVGLSTYGMTLDIRYSLGFHDLP